MTKTKTPEDVVSVRARVPFMPKYIVEIATSEVPGAPDPVFLGNGDYQVTVKRGIPVVCSEASLTVLKDAITGIVDPITHEVKDVPSYPFSARLYEGDQPIGTIMERA